MKPTAEEMEVVKESKSEKQLYKYTKIKTDLSIQILEGKLRPHDRIPSLSEISQKYKVSKITARRVLNELVIEGLVYTSRGRGTFVADSASRQNSHYAKAKGDQLGVVFEHGSGSFMSDIIMGIDEEAYLRKSQINLCLSNNSYEREAENLQRLTQQGIDKILLFMVLQNDSKVLNPNIPLYMRLLDRGIKILLLGCRIPGFPIPALTFDGYNSYKGLVGFLKKKGCTRLAYVSRLDNASTTVDRFSGFKDGLLENGLSYDESLILRIQLSSNHTEVSDSKREFDKFYESRPKFDAIVCSDEMIAAGIFFVFEQLGIPAAQRPIVGGMGSMRSLHVLKGNPYVLLEDDTHRLGREAAAAILRNELPNTNETDMDLFHRRIPVPLRVPKKLR